MKFFKIICLFLLYGSLYAIPNYYELAIQNRKAHLGRILKQKEIIIGLQKNHIPYTTNNPNYPGIDVEIIQLLAKTFNAKYKIRYGTIHQLLTWISNHEIDLALGGISTDIKRGLAVNFSIPYIITSPAGILNKRRLPKESLSVDYPQTKIQNLKDIINLSNLRIAVKKGTTYEKFLKENPEFHKHQIILYPTNKEALNSVLEGTNDLFISDRVLIKAYLIKSPKLYDRFHPILHTYRKEYISMLLPPDDLNFLYYINFFIKELKRTGVLEKIINKYLESNQWAKP